MKTLVLLVGVLAAAVSGWVVTGYEPQLVILPGTDYVGWGFDATYRDHFFAMTKQVVTYTYDNNPNQREVIYRYPTQRQNYAVPDQVAVRTIGTTTAESELFDSWENFRMTLDLKIALELGYPSLTGFIQIGLGIKLETNNKEYMVRTESKNMMWQMTLTSIYLAGDFMADVEELSRHTYSSNAPLYNKFVHNWGTHMIDKVVMGGTAITDTKITAESMDMAISITLTLGLKMSAVELSLSLGIGIETQRASEETISSSTIVGGNPQVGSFVAFANDPQALKKLFDTWKSTIPKIPGVVEQHLIELWTIIPDPKVGKNVCLASKALLNGETKISGC